MSGNPQDQPARPRILKGSARGSGRHFENVTKSSCEAGRGSLRPRNVSLERPRPRQSKVTLNLGKGRTEVDVGVEVKDDTGVTVDDGIHGEVEVEGGVWNEVQLHV